MSKPFMCPGRVWRLLATCGSIALFFAPPGLAQQGVSMSDGTTPELPFDHTNPGSCPASPALPATVRALSAVDGAYLEPLQQFVGEREWRSLGEQSQAIAAMLRRQQTGVLDPDAYNELVRRERRWRLHLSGILGDLRVAEPGSREAELAYARVAPLVEQSGAVQAMLLRCRRPCRRYCVPCERPRQCAGAGRQSPILIDARFVVADPEDLAANFGEPIAGAASHYNKYGAVEIMIPNPRPSLTVGDRTYYLEQFHFHHPAEHRFRIRDAVVPPAHAEVHFVYSTRDYHEAVLATFVEIGEQDNQDWAPVLGRLPPPPPLLRRLERLDLSAMLHLHPEGLDAETIFRYDGSLTTEPYREGVTWLVRTRTVTWSQAQLNALKRAMEQNNRDLQPHNCRPIYRRN